MKTSSRPIVTLFAVGFLSVAGVSRAADEAGLPPVESVGQLLAQVDVAARGVARLAGAARHASPAQIGALCDDWVHQRVVLTPSFLADFPHFRDLADLASTVEQQVMHPPADGLAPALEAYRTRLAELADAIGASSALVVSGGVSLGSYQGGFLQYYTQFLLAQSNAVQDRYKMAAIADGSGIRLATGASAGSINAFIASLTRCRAPVWNPRASLFWAAWIPVGFDRLIDRTAVTFDGVLSAKPLDEAIGRLGPLWNEPQNISGWTANCEAIIGLSATRLKARDLDFSGGTSGAGSDALRLKRQTEKFVLRLVGRPGAAPRLGPFRPPAPSAADGHSPIDMIYPTLGQDSLGVEGRIEDHVENTFDQVANLLKASAAFPLAFSPVPVDMTVWRRVENREAFVPLEHGPVRFVDGGVLDNTPIGLAVKIEGWLRAGGNTVPEQLVFLSSDAVGWTRTGSAAAQPGRSSSLFGTYGPFLQDFITTAEQNELLNTLENQSSIPRNVPARMMPIAGEQLGHFFGFAEEDFRTFDFFMGMVDAREYLASQHHLAVEFLSAAHGAKVDAETASPLRVDAPEFACFDQHRRLLRAGALGDTHQIPACASVSPNLIALLRASTALRARAQKIGSKGPALTIDDFLKAIDDAGYKYKQLRYRGKPATARTATLALRDSAQDVINELGSKQPFLEGYPVQFVGKALANSFEYKAPRWIFSAGGLFTGGGELGVTRLWSPRQRLSLGLSGFARLLRWENHLIVQHGMLTDPVAVTWAANVGPQIEYAFGPRLQLDALGGFEVDQVTAREFWNPFYRRYGWFAQADLVLYQRLYVFFGVHNLPGDTRPAQDVAAVGETHGCCDYRAGFGLRFFSH